MNTYLRKKAETDFEKCFFKLIDNAVFQKAMKKVRKHRYTKLVTTEARKCHLVLEPNYNTSKFLSENLLAIEMGNRILILKPFCLGL